MDQDTLSMPLYSALEALKPMLLPDLQAAHLDHLLISQHGYIKLVYIFSDHIRAHKVPLLEYGNPFHIYSIKRPVF